MIECLSAVDASVIASISYEFVEPLKDPLRLYSPSIELNETSSEPFLTRHPYEILAEGSQKNVPWMVGFNSAEGLIVTLGIYESDEWTQEMNLNWNNLAPQFLVYNKNDTNLINSINEFYLNVTISDNIDFQADMQGFTNIFSDRLYIHASLEAVKIQGNFSPVFLYYNDYATESNQFGVGTSHGEELSLLFSPPDFSLPITEGHPDYEQSKIMVDLWAQFVTDPYTTKFGNDLWHPVDSTEKEMTCLNLKNPIKGEQGVGSLSDAIIKRVEFWNSNGVPPYQVFKDL
ncbi:Venom carboxylesterase-6 [Orchesella cincta]|uniref:Venom carboxylesterase-6 n=1 Tax=Orchesella cincta TaxID=48709 RepID=A0A1D2NGX2_ORCCI|nr:Venom carboxylesterase-6 [Orchesella cincta]